MKKQDRYEVLAAYRRTVSSNAETKYLIEVRDDKDVPSQYRFGNECGDLCPEVIFYKLISCSSHKLFWGKKYCPPKDSSLLVSFENAIYSDLKVRPFNTILPLEYHPEYGFIYEFNPELFGGLAVHYYERARLFNKDECREIEKFADTRPLNGRFRDLPYYFLTDFQTVRTSKGLTHIDFEMNHNHKTLIESMSNASSEVEWILIRNQIMKELQKQRIPRSNRNYFFFRKSFWYNKYIRS
jgi:hypothetical protein